MQPVYAQQCVNQRFLKQPHFEQKVIENKIKYIVEKMNPRKKESMICGKI